MDPSRAHRHALRAFPLLRLLDLVDCRDVGARYPPSVGERIMGACMKSVGRRCPTSGRNTYATLHMWTQVVGKVALAKAPPLNHSWGIALQMSPRGLSTQTAAGMASRRSPSTSISSTIGSRYARPMARPVRCRSHRAPSQRSTPT